VFGLAFATALTLIVTPAALMVFSRSNDSKLHGLFGRLFAFIRRIFRRGKKADGAMPEAEPAVSTRPAIDFPKAAE
jgi:multidrug efflux pump